jgi:hypothetical protein
MFLIRLHYNAGGNVVLDAQLVTFIMPADADRPGGMGVNTARPF